MRRRKRSRYELRQAKVRAVRRALAGRIRRAERAVDGVQQELLNDRDRREPMYGSTNRHVLDSIGSARHSLAIARSYL